MIVIPLAAIQFIRPWAVNEPATMVKFLAAAAIRRYRTKRSNRGPGIHRPVTQKGPDRTAHASQLAASFVHACRSAPIAERPRGAVCAEYIGTARRPACSAAALIVTLGSVSKGSPRPPIKSCCVDVIRARNIGQRHPGSNAAGCRRTGLIRGAQKPKRADRTHPEQDSRDREKHCEQQGRTSHARRTEVHDRPVLRRCSRCEIRSRHDIGNV